MTDIRLFLDTRRESGDPTPPYAVIHDDHIRAIVKRAEEMGLLNQPTIAPMSFANYPIKDKPAAPAFTGTPDAQEPKVWMDNNGGMPAAPADDEATEFSQSDLIIESAIGRMIAERCGLRISGLDERRILTAIRRGEATGLTTTVEAQEALTAAHAWADAEIKRLHVECDNFKAEVERLSKGNHEPCIARAEGLESALKTSKAEVERLRAELVKWHETHPPSICSAHDRVQLDCPICNPALAMLKTAREERDAAERKLRDAFTQIREDPIDTNKVIEDLSNSVYRERAAHAQAIQLLDDAAHHIRAYGHDKDLVEFIDTHLAKHQNKDATDG